ncbi:MAG: hypothetical protein KDB65_06355 [Calditrichaeota bacterium]|nr:hypothetical protein [Calditrichota bacterium]MCB9367842.1 hypothetical protein [Calditrichota bacterium]
MKTLWTTCLVLLLASFAIAEEFAAPILLTSGGQSADAQMVKTLLMREKIPYDLNLQATSKDLENHATVVIVLGGSSKGLGAAKVSAEQESARISELLDKAREESIPVLALHIGGKNRRGALSDEFNRLGAEKADEVIVVSGGDDDGMFKSIAKEKKTPIFEAAKIADLGPMLRERFVAPEETSEE